MSRNLMTQRKTLTEVYELKNKTQQKFKKKLLTTWQINNEVLLAPRRAQVQPANTHHIAVVQFRQWLNNKQIKLPSRYSHSKATSKASADMTFMCKYFYFLEEIISPRWNVLSVYVIELALLCCWGSSSLCMQTHLEAIYTCCYVQSEVQSNMYMEEAVMMCSHTKGITLWDISNNTDCVSCLHTDSQTTLWVSSSLIKLY